MIVLLAAGLAAPIPKTSHAAEVCAPVLARVVSLQGTVEFRSSETEPWTDAALNDLLCADYWIRVGPASRAALALPNDSVLRLDQQTTVRLRAQAEETRSLLELLLGTLYLFSHRPRALEIDTPFVNAATEGTEFLVSVGADQTRDHRVRGSGPGQESRWRAAAGLRRCRGRGGRRGAPGADRRAAARCGRLDALLSADPGGAGRARAGGARPAAGPADRGRPGRGQRLSRRPARARHGPRWRARRPLLHLSRRRAAERRARGRGARGDRAGAGARSGGGRGAGRSGRSSRSCRTGATTPWRTRAARSS